MTILSGGAIAALTVPQIARFVLPAPKETRLADYLPFDSIEPDGRTVRCRDGSYCQFLSIQGIDQGFTTYTESIALNNTRREFYDALSEHGATIRIYTIRERVDASAPGEYPNEYAAAVAERWNDQFQHAFRTRSIFCISIKPGRGIAKLEEVMDLAMSLLHKFEPSRLTQNADTSTDADITIGSFLGRLSSPITRPGPTGMGEYLSDTIAADEICFLKNGMIRFDANDKTKYCSAIGIRRLGSDVNTLMASELGALAGEMVILQTVQPMPKAQTLIKLNQQMRMMAGSNFSPQVVQQYQMAIEAVEGNAEHRSMLCNFTEVIFLYADTREELEVLERECRQILTSHGITPVREKGASQAAWFSQFPTHDYNPRVYRLMSATCAILTTFDRSPSGLPKSDWGPGPIALFNTGSGNVYSHQFHSSPAEGAVGHGLCIAPTGAGKTVLMEFLSCMASRHPKLRHFFFDRYQGTYPYTTIMGGKYLGFNADKFTRSIRGGMNPFHLEDTDTNREFLRVWLQGISGVKNDSEALVQISQAVDLAYDHLEKHERSLANVYEGVFTAGSDVKKGLFKWVDPSQYGSMFNAEEDCIDLDGNWLTTFDMTNLQNDPELGGAAISYIMHQIRQSMSRNRAPGFIFIDETEPLLKNESFLFMYRTMLQEFRKLGGVIISVFQRPEALQSAGISELVRQQSSAFYLFQNPGAQAEDYKELNLNERELGFILGQTKTARRSSRSILVKRPSTGESVVLDIDLGVLGPYLRIFSSSAKDVQLASDLQRDFGEDWVKRYIDNEAP